MSVKEIHEDSILDWSPRRLHAAQGYLSDLREGLVPDWWSECICQKSNLAGRLTIVDAGTMQTMETWLLIGYLSVGRIRVGEGPESDKMRQKNQDILNSLPHGLDADVFDDHDCDGSVAVPDGLDMKELMPPPDFSHSRWTPDRCVLEVGTTGSHNTLFHITRNRWLARWPYGHDLYFFNYRGPHPIERDDPAAEKESRRRVKHCLKNPLPVAPSRAITDMLGI